MLIPIDEAWMAMTGPFLELLDIGIRTFRRDNARVVFATQSGKDLADSELAKIVLNACSLKVFFPDKAMKDDDVAAAYVACGVDADLIDRMTYEFKPDEQRWCLVVQSGGSRIIYPDLGKDIAPESYQLCCATNSKAVADARRIQEMPGNFFDNWMAEKLGEKAGPRRSINTADEMLEAAE